MSESNPLSPNVDDNPYRVTSVGTPTASPRTSEAAAIREEHIYHEASIKSVGGLYVLVALAGIGFSILMLITAFADSYPSLLLGALVLVPVSIAFGIGGIGLHNLSKSGKRTATLISVIGLVGVPLGTLLSIYILYLLFSQKGTMVFSPEYKNVIAQSPGVRAKTSIVVWIVLVGFVATLALGVIAALSLR